MMPSPEDLDKLIAEIDKQLGRAPNQGATPGVPSQASYYDKLIGIIDQELGRKSSTTASRQNAGTQYSFSFSSPRGESSLGGPDLGARSWMDDSDRLISMIDRALGAKSEAFVSRIEKEKPPEPQENFAGRPGAYFTSRLKSLDEEIFPKLREKGAWGKILDVTADPVLAGLDTLWSAYTRPTFGMQVTMAEKWPEYREKIYEPWVEKLAEPRGGWAEKGTLKRTLQDMYTFIPQTAGALLWSLAALKEAPRHGIDVGELWKQGYEDWEKLPQRVKTGSYFVDPLEIVSGAAGLATKPARAFTKARLVKNIPIFGDEIRHLAKFVEPLSEVGEALKPAEELGLKTARPIKWWNPLTWFGLTPESKMIESALDTMDLVGSEMMLAKNADEVASTFEKFADAEKLLASPEKSARSLVGQRTAHLMGDLKGRGEFLANVYKEGQGKWAQFEQIAQDMGVTTNDLIRLADAKQAPKEVAAMAQELKQVPRTLTELKANLMVEIGEHVGNKAVEIFGAGKRGWFNQLHNIAKMGQSYVFLGTNPMYVVMNVMNNMATAAVHGVPGYIKPSRLWERMGIAPMRARAGIGAADIRAAEQLEGAADTALRAIQEGTRAAQEGGGSGALTRLEQFVAKGKDTPLGLVTRVAQKMEQLQGESAFAAGVIKAWRQFWRYGEAIPEIPADLAAKLDQYGITGQVRSAIKAAMNPDEITRVLYETGRNADSTLHRLAEAGIIKDSDVEVLTGQLSHLLQRLSDAVDPVAEYQKIMRDMVNETSSLYQDVLRIQKEFDTELLRQNLYGGALGIWDDAYHELRNAFATRDHMMALYWNGGKKGHGVQYEEFRKLIDSVFETAFDKNDQRITLIEDMLKRAGHNTEDWFVPKDLIRKKRKQALLAERKLDFRSPTFYEDKAKIWEDYFQWYDEAHNAALGNMLHGFTQQSDNPEVVGVIRRITEMDMAARERTREALMRGWAEVRGLSPEDASVRHAQMRAEIEQIWGEHQREFRDLTSELAMKVKGAPEITPTMSEEQLTEALRAVGEGRRANVPDISGLHDISYPNPSLDPVEYQYNFMEIINRVFPHMIDEMQYSPGPILQGVDDATKKALKSYLKQQVLPAMNDARIGALKMGEYWRDQAMLNYNRRYGYNQLLGYIFPYEFWFTTSLGHWAKKFIRQPELLAIYARMKRDLNKHSEDLPSRLRGMVKVNMPFLPDWMGPYFIDPLSAVLPFEQFLYGIRSLEWEDERERIRKDLEYARKAGKPQEIIDELERQLNETPERSPLEYMSIFTSPGLHWQILARLAGIEKEPLGPISPGSRYLKGLDTLRKMAMGQEEPGVDVEASIRRWMNERLGTRLPEQDEWELYRVRRMLSNMAAEGVITSEEAKRAMIEMKGPTWEKAVARAAQERALGAIIPGRDAPFPVGEQEQRRIASERKELYEAKPPEESPLYERWEEMQRAFYKKYPEYDVRQMTFQLPGARYYEYLKDAIWEERNRNPLLVKVLYGLGYEKDLKDHAEGKASFAQLAKLAAAMKIKLPQMPEAPIGEPEPPFVGTPEYEPGPEAPPITDEDVKIYTAYLNDRERLFGKDIATKSWQYAQIREQSGKKAASEYLKQHPELKSYWAFNDDFKKKHPKIAAMIWPQTADQVKQSQELIRRSARLKPWDIRNWQ